MTISNMQVNKDIVNNINPGKNLINTMYNLYQHAECFFPWNLQNRVFNSTVFPYWTHDALYYFQELCTGKLLLKVDIQTGKRETVLDYKLLIDALSHQLQKIILSVPLDQFSMKENPLLLCFSYEKDEWHYNIEKHTLRKHEKIFPAKLKSPDNNWTFWIKDYNIFLTDLKHNQDYQLTTDGKQYYDYATSPETNTHAVTQRLEGTVFPPVAIWSSDSRKIITHKLDQRQVKTLHLLQNAPDNSQRPVLHSYRMSFSGDENLPLAELVIVDVLSKTVIPLKTEPLLSPYLTPIEFKWVWWSNDNQKIYFLRETRGSKELILYVADANTGIIKPLIQETAETYIEPSQHFLWPHQVIVLEDTDEIIWLSECSNYAHLYLYDKESNAPKQAITKGDWCVREAHFYDEKNNWLYFTACGYYKDIDPYYKQLFRCHLDGTGVECLTKENAHHSIYISLNKNRFLDTYSTINTEPVSILKSMDGKTICPLETANINGLTSLNWVRPKRFIVKARDGITPIYGNMYFPSSFDANKKYPIIDHIYPGPQLHRVPLNFTLHGAIFRSGWTAQALAELGFIVVHIDGLGTPGRSKSFHDATYENMSDCSIPDHVVSITQLAEEYNFIDLERVGITGYSGGAFAASRAMLMYPEFFKVGVAAAGNHDLRCYPASYGEKYNGLNTDTYVTQSNAYHAEKLEGKLLLIHGEMDDNVHPCATLQLVDALIKHNKDFDMLIMPNQNHRSTFDHPYYMRRLWDYFVIHLLYEVPPKNYQIKPMPLDFPQLMDW